MLQEDYLELIKENPGVSATSFIDDARDDFFDAFKEVFGLESKAPPPSMTLDDWLAARKVYGMARQIAGIAASLVRQKGIGSDRLAFGASLAADARAHSKAIEEFVESYQGQIPDDKLRQLRALLDAFDASDPRGLRWIFRETVLSEALRLFPPSPRGLAERLENLTQYVVAARNDLTNQYLARVARCYCLDLRAELAVMARAVLDSALEDAVNDEDIRRRRGLAKRVRVGLGERIHYLSSSDRIRPPDVKAMLSVKTSGDDAAHCLPGLEQDPDTLMQALVDSLKAIDRYVHD
jgi:hypothetical protein